MGQQKKKDKHTYFQKSNYIFTPLQAVLSYVAALNWKQMEKHKIECYNWRHAINKIIRGKFVGKV